MNTQIEELLKETIFPDLLKGRRDFDLPHTKAVVYWMKQILTSLPKTTLNPDILICSAYAHDWGYIGLFENVDSNDPVIIATRKPLHMQRGSEMIQSLLLTKARHYLSDQDIARIAHLVSIHDRVENLIDEDELMLMEADTLGMLDTTRVRPTFSKSDNDAFIQKEIYQRRKPRFIHPFAIKKLEQLAIERKNYFFNI